MSNNNIRENAKVETKSEQKVETKVETPKGLDIPAGMFAPGTEWQPVPLKVSLGEEEKVEQWRHFNFKPFQFIPGQIERDASLVALQRGEHRKLFQNANLALLGKDLTDEAKVIKAKALEFAQNVLERVNAWAKTLGSEKDKGVGVTSLGARIEVPMQAYAGRTMEKLVLEMASGHKDEYFSKAANKNATKTSKTGGKNEEVSFRTDSFYGIAGLTVAVFDDKDEMITFAEIVTKAASKAQKGDLQSANGLLDHIAFKYGAGFGFGIDTRHEAENGIRAALEFFAQLIQLRIFGATCYALGEMSKKLVAEAKENRQSQIVNDDSLRKAKEAREALEREKAREENKTQAASN